MSMAGTCVPTISVEPKLETARRRPDIVSIYLYWHKDCRFQHQPVVHHTGIPCYLTASSCATGALVKIAIFFKSFVLFCGATHT